MHQKTLTVPERPLRGSKDIHFFGQLFPFEFTMSAKAQRGISCFNSASWGGGGGVQNTVPNPTESTVT